ncbi:MAG: hypothetical protein KBB72_10390 [Candidatus Kapabacteria bacterium]|nr:hypothetical protein [Candidatus Kapabacteria bacterium]
MTNQELLAGFLDRSLSEDGLLEFEARKTASPEFASEVREMLTVEELLTTAAPRVHYPVEFLASVESAIATKVAAGATASGFFTSLAQNAWTWIAGGTAAVVIGGGAIYLASTPSPEPTTHAKATISAAPSPGNAQTVATPAPAPTVEHAPVGTRSNARPQPTMISTETTPSSVELNANTSEPDPVTKQIIAEYEKCKGSNDQVRCAQLALQIGIKLRKDDHGTEARQYLEAAIGHARQLKLAEFEMDANGELGLLASTEGDEQRAAAAFRRAIEIGDAQKKNTSRWSSALEDLGKR